MTDDILIYDASEEEHNANLVNVLRTLEERGLTLNADKCEFYQEEVVFFGLRFSKNGIAPTDDRCRCARRHRRRTSRSCAVSSAWCNSAHVSLASSRTSLSRSGDSPRRQVVMARGAAERVRHASSEQYQAEALVLSTRLADGSGCGRKPGRPQGHLAQVNPADVNDSRVDCFASRLLTATENDGHREAILAVRKGSACRGLGL